jgi:hypothetical protein
MGWGIQNQLSKNILKEKRRSGTPKRRNSSQNIAKD